MFPTEIFVRPVSFIVTVSGVLERPEEKMSAEEADKTATTDANAGDEEEEWLYGGK